MDTDSTPVQLTLTKNRLPNVGLTNDAQIAFGDLLGLDLRGHSTGVAYARIEDLIADRFWGHSDVVRPSAKQCALALKFGFNIEAESKAVGAAVVDDIMFQLNMDAIELQGLAPGVKVKHKMDELERLMVVSSVAANGTVYFKGGNGQKAWARNLVRAEQS